jgi:glycosyltransferase involved in cell wall biosynthesis
MSIVLMTSEPRRNAYAADHELAGSLNRSGWDVAVQPADGLTLAGAPDLGHELARRWRRQPPDAVLAHGWLAGLAAQVAARDTQIPVLQRFDRLTRDKDDPGRSRLEAAVGRAAAVVLAACREDVEQLVACGIPRRRIRVVPHAIDTAVFSDEGPAWERTHRRRLVAVDDLTDGSATAALVSALPALPESELLVIATRPSENDPVVEKLIRMARDKRVSDRLRFLDPLSPAELPRLLRSADLAVAPGNDSDIDFVLQAMACGLPVVAAESGAVADAVADGVTGVLVPPRSPGRLGDAVRSLLSDALTRETFGLAGTDRARVRFGLEAVAETMSRLLGEVTADKRVVRAS